jgi:hypothetical protein
MEGVNKLAHLEFGAKFPSLKRRGGCGINKMSRSHRSAADGVVSSAPCSGLSNFAELTTPAVPFRNGTFSLLARPTLLLKVVNFARFQFADTFLGRAYSA